VVGPNCSRGDFNLVRSQKEKSNGLINFKIVDVFNEWIDKWGLIDIKDPTRPFTWSNNQEHPILATLDRVLVSVHWKVKYPLAKVTMLHKGVSDHNPLAISFGDKV
jgi:endonuclease/exonuclease/phosphatase family metal-dependent hydrolase